MRLRGVNGILQPPQLEQGIVVFLAHRLVHLAGSRRQLPDRRADVAPPSRTLHLAPAHLPGNRYGCEWGNSYLPRQDE
jgi:hypothetical protein